MSQRRPVRPGERLNIAASQINFLNQLMTPDVSFRAGPKHDWRFSGTVVLVRNDSEVDVPRWGVLKVSGIAIAPASSDSAERSFGVMPCVSGVVPDAGDNEFVVAVEPVAAGKVGRAAIAGLTQVKLTGGDGSSKKAKPEDGNKDALAAGNDGPATIVWRDGEWGLVRLGGGGGELRLCKTTSKWAKDTTATLDVWEAGTPTAPAANDPAVTVADAINLFRDVDANVFVVVGKAENGRWYLVEAGNPPIDGDCRKPVVGGDDLTTLVGYDPTKTQLLGHDGYGCLRWLDTTDCAPSSPPSPP